MTTSQAEPLPEEQISLAVSGMTCGGCARAVERALGRVPGVERAVVDLGTGQAHVEGTASAQALVGAITDAGYAAEPLGSGATRPAAGLRHGCCGA